MKYITKKYDAIELATFLENIENVDAKIFFKELSIIEINNIGWFDGQKIDIVEETIKDNEFNSLSDEFDLDLDYDEDVSDLLDEFMLIFYNKEII